MAQLTLDDVLKSKTFIKDGVGISFQSPKAYIEPFLERVSKLTNDFEVAVSIRTANKNEIDNSINEAFARVKVEARLPSEYNVEEHTSVIGLVYGLDTQKPVMKVYSGRNAWACTNLAVFRADHIHQVDLLQGVSTIYEKSKTFVEQQADHIQSFATRVKAMKDKQYAGEKEIDEVVGALIRKGIALKNVGTSPMLAAATALHDKASVYGIRDDRTTQWNVYSAVTQYITDKADIVDKCTKTLYVSNIFENLHIN